MAQFTKQIEIAADFVNLLTAMQAAGYTGTAALCSLQIINNNADAAYIHLTNDSDTEPADGDHGIPIGTAEPDVSWSYSQAGEEVMDAATTWLYSDATVTVVVAAIGGGI